MEAWRNARLGVLVRVWITLTRAPNRWGSERCCGVCCWVCVRRSVWMTVHPTPNRLERR